MKRIIKIAALVCAVVLSSCGPQEDEKMVAMDSFMEQQNVPGLYRDSKVEYAYNEQTDQCYINTSKRTFRIMNEAGDKYLQFTLSDAPVEGQSVDVVAKSSGFGLSSNTTYTGLKVEKLENNLCHLRSNAEGGYIGIIIAWKE